MPPRIHLAALAAIVAAACTGNPSEAARLPQEASAVATRYAEECDADVAPSCFALDLLYQLGDDGYHGVPGDPTRAEALRAHACELGHAPACADDALLPPAAVVPEGSGPPN